MSPVTITNLTISQLHAGLSEKRFSAHEVAQAFLDAIGAHNDELGAYLSVHGDEALKTADEVDRMIARGEDLPPLAGIPLAIKDNMLIKGLPATAGSKILERYTASYDAGVIKKLKAQHAVFLGKTNLDEFAMGSSNENSAFRPVRNPHDTTRVPGGSSGGSAAAVAAGLATAALGSDTGGSIRLPASFCGVVGLKPTYGAVSRSGLIAMASSLDQIGPLTRTVGDAALLFNAIRGYDSLDATSVEAKDDMELFAPSADRLHRLVIGLPDEYFIDGIDPAVARAVQSAIHDLTELGFTCKRVSLPHTKYALSTYYIIMPAEVSSNLARFDGIRYSRDPNATNQLNLMDMYFKQRGIGFGAEAKRRIILGTFVLSSGYYDAYYQKAQQVRALIARDFDEAFKSVDVVLSPVAPTPAFKLGERTEDPLSMYLADIFTITANLAGLPAISIPIKTAHLEPPAKATAGKHTSQLPIGFQLIGKPFHEADIIGIGRCYEEQTPA
jgi:aspartyl-tRNA(Asn)/glutamyl-tRNA(Gln) amidotransferase subunit A